MKIQHVVEDDGAERMLRDAYLSQPVVLPREEWVRSVMARVRQEPRPERLVAPMSELVAWRMGWVAAAAALIFAVLNFTSMPSKDLLTWDLYKGGAMAQLSVRLGE